MRSPHAAPLSFESTLSKTVIDMNKLNFKLPDFKLPKLKMKPRAKPVALSLYFGIPGAGKSTYAAYLAK